MVYFVVKKNILIYLQPLCHHPNVIHAHSMSFKQPNVIHTTIHWALAKVFAWELMAAIFHLIMARFMFGQHEW